MRASAEGAAFVRSFESCELATYLDLGGRPTIGWGHLVRPGDLFPGPITQAEADALFAEDLAQAEFAANAEFGDALAQRQFDACASLCFNIGARAFTHSTLARLLALGDVDGAAGQFALWCHVDGRASQGLYDRRAAEREIFLNGIYVNHR